MISAIEEVPDSQYFPEGSDLSVNHLSHFHRVSVQLLQVSLSKQGAQAHHLLVSVKSPAGCPNVSKPPFHVTSLHRASMQNISTAPWWWALVNPLPVHVQTPANT